MVVQEDSRWCAAKLSRKTAAAGLHGCSRRQPLVPCMAVWEDGRWCVAFREDSRWWKASRSGLGRQLLVHGVVIRDGKMAVGVQHDGPWRWPLVGIMVVWDDGPSGDVVVQEDDRWWAVLQSGKTAAGRRCCSPGKWPLVSGVVVREDNCWRAVLQCGKAAIGVWCGGKTAAGRQHVVREDSRG